VTASIRAIIVDDEPLARRGVRARLEKDGGVEIVAECENGEGAVRAIESLAPDVVFLDVQMPVMDGFDVLGALAPETTPMIVFLTAFDEYALRAFDAAALDYLLKPIDDERFAQTMARLRARLRQDPAARVPTRLIVRDRGHVVLIDFADIRWVEADGDYVRLHVAGRSHLVRETLTVMARRLPAAAFVRIHRSVIVNASQVKELRPMPNREQVVVLRDGTQLKLSRGYRDSVTSLLQAASAESARGRA
jgi:two-component system, LytTR family, response regulator